MMPSFQRRDSSDELHLTAANKFSFSNLYSFADFILKAIPRLLYNYIYFVLYKIIDVSFRQRKINAQYSFQTINNIVKYQISIDTIESLEAV